MLWRRVRATETCASISEGDLTVFGVPFCCHGAQVVTWGNSPDDQAESASREGQAPGCTVDGQDVREQSRAEPPSGLLCGRAQFVIGHSYATSMLRHCELNGDYSCSALQSNPTPTFGVSKRL